MIATRTRARLLGLAWLEAEAAPALLLPRCRSVHTAGMRFRLEIAFLAVCAEPAVGAAGFEVLAVERAVGPGRLVSHPRPTGLARAGAIAVLELATGHPAAAELAPGERLEIAAGGEAERLRGA